MNKSDAGRKAFVAMLGAIVHPGELNPNGQDGRRSVG
jgi:hypothetical protein